MRFSKILFLLSAAAAAQTTTISVTLTEHTSNGMTFYAPQSVGVSTSVMGCIVSFTTKNSNPNVATIVPPAGKSQGNSADFTISTMLVPPASGTATITITYIYVGTGCPSGTFVEVVDVTVGAPPGSNPPPQPFSFLPAGHFAFEFQDMSTSSFSLAVGPAGDLTIFDAGTPFVNASGSCDLMTDMCTAMGAGGASYQLMLPSMTFMTFPLVFNNGAGAMNAIGLQVGQIAPQPNLIQAFTGDPVSDLSGESFSDFPPDLDLDGPLPLRFRRYYGSALTVSYLGASMGNNWMHNFDWKLDVSGNAATVVEFRGGTIRFQKNGNAWQLHSADRYDYQLINTGNTYQFLDPATNLIYFFGANGLLTQIADRNGNALTVTQGQFGPTQVSDGLGRTLTFTYTAAGKLSAVQDQTNRVVSFSYTGSDLTGVTDPNGKVTSFSYTANPPLVGLMTKVVRPAGNAPLSQTFDQNGRVISQTDGLGNTTNVQYSTTQLGTATQTDPLGNMTTNQHASLVDLTASTDSAGHNSSYSYDATNRMTTAVDRDNATRTATYHNPSGYFASLTDPSGKTTTFAYAAQAQGGFTFYNRTGITYSDGSSISYTYDANGNRLTSTDALGKVRAYTYNAHGEVLTFTNEVGGITSNSYNADGTLASLTSPAGDITTYGYDQQKRVVRIQYPDSTVRSFGYDANDRILTFTDERSKSLNVAYTGNGTLQSITDASNQSTSFTHDADDNVTGITDPLGGVTGYQYNAVSLASTLSAPAGETRSFAYDSLNRLSSISDAAGALLKVGYDAEGNVTSIADGLSRTTQYTLDSLGRVTAVTTPLSRAYRKTLDSLGRVTSLTDPLSRTVNFSFDARGLLSSVGFPGGSKVGITRSDLGPVSGVTDQNGGLWARQYDSSGRLTSRTDPLGRVTSIAYDSRNRTSGITTPIGSVTYTYDSAGNLIRRATSDGLTLNFTVDSLDRVTGGDGFSIGYDAAGRMVNSNGLTIGRDASGKIISVTYAPGKTLTYGYDSRGMLASVADWASGLVKLGYDKALNLISITRSNGVVTQIGYDGDGNIASMNTSGGAAVSSIALQTDATGHVISSNRTVPQLAQLPGGATQLGFDAAHQISGASYDGLGRLTSYGGRSYTWDIASRLTAYEGSDGSATFGYDALDFRTSRPGPDGKPVNFVLNYALGLPSVAIERTAAGDQRYYVYLPDGTLLYSIEASGNSRHFYHFDEAGNTIFLTDDQGAVTDSYGITPYGGSVTHNGSSDNPFTWQGAFGVMQEGSTGLYYVRARYYDSATGRFLSKDPLATSDPMQTNPYLYALDNPIMYTDPLGTSPPQLFINSLSDTIFQPNGSYTPVIVGTELKDLGILGWQFANFHTQQFTSFARSFDAHFNAIADGLVNIEQIERINQNYLQGVRTDFQALKPGANPLTKWYTNNVTQLEELEETANKVRPLGTAGKVLAGVGIALDGGLTIYDGVSHGDSAGVVVLDTSATVIGDAAVLAAPPLAVADALTLGGVSGGITNAILAPVDYTKVIVSDRVTWADAARIKRRWTRKPLLRGIWNVGEWIADKIFD